MSAEEIRRSLSSDSVKALILGNQIFIAPVMAGGRPFVFTRDQAYFLMALQNMKNIHAAAVSVGKDEAWADKFLSCKKFVAFRNWKLEESRAKNGITIDYLMQYMEWTMEGKKKWYEATCQCGFVDEWSIAQAERCRDDDMNFVAQCEICYRPMVLKYMEDKFEPTREQNEMWKEAAARLWPKVERVHHQFSSEEFVFENGKEEE